MSGAFVVEITEQQTAVSASGGMEVVLSLTMPGIQGPQGAPGEPGEQGPAGPPGPAGAAREEETAFAIPAPVWEVTHTLPVTPSVYTYDTGGVLIEGDVSYPTPTSVRVEWAWPMAGRLVVTT